MARNDIWQQFQVANPAEKFWSGHVAPRRGEYGGPCSNVLCDGLGADWYNRKVGAYYCDICARRINQACLKLGVTKHCELHI